MRENAQVLSQLLWDLHDDEKRQKTIITNFYNNLITPSGRALEMSTTIAAPLECILQPNGTPDMAESYLDLCGSVSTWPYNAFLVALIDIMEKSSEWATDWKDLSATLRQKKVVLAETYKDDIERLYATNVTVELRPIVGGHRALVHDYYRMRWGRESFIRRDHYFVNLKGMSSSSPTLYNNTFGTRLRGGGFYFRWNMLGVAVDPGLNFVTNMHEHGLSISEIDAVIITHDHLDHTGDMMILDDLEYQIRGKKTIKWYVCKEIYDEKKLDNMELVYQGLEIDISPHITLRATETKHMKDSSGNYLSSTFGCLFTLKGYTTVSDEKIKERIMGYTSDTTYWPEMEKDYDNADLLIVNISSVREADIFMEEQNELHLGFNGCMKMLMGFHMLPQMLLLSEFWNGIEDIRFPISKQLARTAQRKYLNAVVLPTEIGMEVDLATMRVKCSCCGTWAKKVSLIRPNSEFGAISYACEDCIL